MNLRKAIARALSSSNLAASEISETAIDRIAAMAFADPLGSALWRLRLAHNPQAFREAHALLSHRMKRVAPDLSVRLKLCETVLREWLDQNCRACFGRGAKVDEFGVKRQCTACEGTGMRRYSDVWRMGQMGFDRKTYGKWERRFAIVHEAVSAADARVYVEVAQQLEWIERRTVPKVVALPKRTTHNRAANEVPLAATATG